MLSGATHSELPRGKAMQRPTALHEKEAEQGMLCGTLSCLRAPGSSGCWGFGAEKALATQEHERAGLREK